MAAKAVAFGEALQPEFKEYAAKIVENAGCLASELKKHGFKLQGDGTQNHLILVDVLSSFNVDGKFFERALDMVGLNLNANSLPTDKGAAFRPSGVRLGTPAITTRGLGLDEMKQIAKWMREVVDICVEVGEESKLDEASKKLEKIAKEVTKLARKFPVPGI